MYANCCWIDITRNATGIFSELKRSFSCLTFRGPYIMIYSYNKSQQDALFHKFILLKMLATLLADSQCN
jgi:hypothetical protein